MKLRNGLLAILFVIFSLPGMAQFLIDLEGSYIASVPYNSVRIPSKGGTFFDLSKDLDRKTNFTFRVRGTIVLKDKHEISLLYAPLTLKYSGTFDKPVFYTNNTFSASQPIDGTYKFNSYRLTYRYRFVNTENWILALGLSAKIREADITLSNGTVKSEYPNVGFVPLINFFASWQFIENVKLVLEGDALGTNQGRAADVFAGLYFSVSENIILKGGYRVLEGGANVESNYNFAWVNYASLGIILKI